VNRLPIHIAFAVLVGAFPASAIDVEKLVMPGPVIRGHADVEGKCVECHTPFRSEEQNDLCVDTGSSRALRLPIAGAATRSTREERPTSSDWTRNPSITISRITAWTARTGA
jgi:hypothetical protein